MWIDVFSEDTPDAEEITTESPVERVNSPNFGVSNQSFDANSTEVQQLTSPASLGHTIPPQQDLPTPQASLSLSQVFGPHSVVGWLVGAIVFLGIIIVISVVCMSQGACHESRWFQKHCCARGEIASISRVSAIEVSNRIAERNAMDATRNRTHRRSSATDTESSHYHPRSIMSQVSQTTDTTTARVSVVTISYSDTSSMLGTSPPPPYVVAIRLPTPGTTPDQSPGFLQDEEGENNSVVSVNLPTYDDCMTLWDPSSIISDVFRGVILAWICS